MSSPSGARPGRPAATAAQSAAALRSAGVEVSLGMPAAGEDPAGGQHDRRRWAQLEAADLAASVALYSALDPVLRPGVAEVGGFTVFAVGARPDSAYLNRLVVSGAGVTEAALDAGLQALAVAGAERPLVRAPAWTGSRLLLPGWLADRGFTPGPELVRLELPLEGWVPPAAAAGFTVELVDAPGAGEVAALLAEAFADADAGMVAATAGSAGRLTALARSPAGRPVGAGSARLHGSVVWCGAGAVLPGWRRRGVHTALLAARLTAARSAGARGASMLAGPAGAAQASVRGLGGRVAYPVLNWTR